VTIMITTTNTTTTTIIHAQENGTLSTSDDTCTDPLFCLDWIILALDSFFSITLALDSFFSLNATNEYVLSVLDEIHASSSWLVPSEPPRAPGDFTTQLLKLATL